MNYLSLNNYLKKEFGCKVYKLAIDGGFTCPNRDGSLGFLGCIFCSGYGSGDFAASRNLSITAQIETAKSYVAGKINSGKYIAYFQAFTNTYAPLEVLREKYLEAINHPDIVALSIATRPDCLSDEILDLLSELNKIKPIWVELGLQTIHSKSADFIRRGYDLSVYDKAVNDLNLRGLYVITHVILGLPGETEEMMLETVRYACFGSADDLKTNESEGKCLATKINGIKLQLLHIIEGTDLARLYRLNHSDISSPYLDKSIIKSDYSFSKSSFSESELEIMKDYECMSMEEYVDLIAKCIEIIPDNIAIHRMTGDGDKKTLLAPLWSCDKKRVLNAINKKLN